MIVGIDPGITSAVVAVNLDGEVVLRYSDRDLSSHEIIEKIVETGKPVVFACDTAKVPSKMERIAANMGAQRFSPQNDLDRSRKETLGEGKNSHEKDAHAAAVNAFKNLRKSIDKVNRRAAESGEDRKDLAEMFLCSDGRP